MDQDSSQNSQPQPSPAGAPTAPPIAAPVAASTQGAGGGTAVPPAAPVSDEKSKQMLAGILAYIGILVIVAYLIGKDDPFVKYHVKQGGVLFGIEVIILIIMSMLPMLAALHMILNLVCIGFSVIGIINVVHHKEKELPFIGQFSKYIPI